MKIILNKLCNYHLEKFKSSVLIIKIKQICFFCKPIKYFNIIIISSPQTPIVKSPLLCYKYLSSITITHYNTFFPGVQHRMPYKRLL